MLFFWYSFKPVVGHPPISLKTIWTSTASNDDDDDDDVCVCVRVCVAPSLRSSTRYSTAEQHAGVSRAERPRTLSCLLLSCVIQIMGVGQTGDRAILGRRAGGQEPGGGGGGGLVGLFAESRKDGPVVRRHSISVRVRLLRPLPLREERLSPLTTPTAVTASNRRKKGRSSCLLFSCNLYIHTPVEWAQLSY